MMDSKRDSGNPGMTESRASRELRKVTLGLLPEDDTNMRERICKTLGKTLPFPTPDYK